MYHDQGLAPFKLLHFADGVNFTAGLPVVRTSPDHGTAHDIAGRGRADPSSMSAALRMAALLAVRRAGDRPLAPGCVTNLTLPTFGVAPPQISVVPRTASPCGAVVGWDD